MGLFSNIFGKKKQALLDAIAHGAAVIDVRTPGEFKSGNVDGSHNIPLDKINSSIKKLKKINKPILVCCASGMRSASAAMILKQNGIDNVFNGGSWTKVNRLING